MKSFQKEFLTWLGDRSEQEAAALLGIGRSTVGAWARGKRQPTALTLEALRHRMASHSPDRGVPPDARRHGR